MMFGLRHDETRELMPVPIMLAHRITRRLSEVRKADVLRTCVRTARRRFDPVRGWMPTGARRRRDRAV